MNDIYSFYKLISEYKIEIPVIQRDYAQGRAESKATDVRKSIVEKILDSVTKGGEKLFFDFVYGRIEGDTFIPFDGQQRLTTLFLFHRYIFEKCKCNSDCMYRENCQCLSLLSRFTYTTRQSSREFCEQMIINNICDCPNRSISENIKDQAWFYSSWEKDPTIAGMLTMLDEIDSQCKTIQNINFKDVAQKLTSGCVCPITFHFVDMGEHKMSDSTYIKMNARGKSLTSFENFKASLEEYLTKNGLPIPYIIPNTPLLGALPTTTPPYVYTSYTSVFKVGLTVLKKRFVDAIDGKWLDLFYNETKPNLPDLTMLSFFKRHFLNYYVANNKAVDKDLIATLENQISADDFIPFKKFERVLKGKERNVLTPLFDLLDALESKHDEIMQYSLPVWYRDDYKNKSNWNLLIGDWNNKGQKTEDDETAGSERYKSRVMFYAVVKYFEKIQGNFCKDQFAQWMRVIWNYTENIRFDKFDNYKEDLELVDNISQYLKPGRDFNNEFALCTSLKSRESRIDEELTKVKLISSDYYKWANRIDDLEKHKYFTGEIKFMFDFLGDNPNEALFDTYSYIMRELFNDKGLNPIYDKNGDYVFRRALMNFSSSYSYGYQMSKNWSFLKDKHRDISWKRFISDSASISTNIPHNGALKSLIEEISRQANSGSKLFADIFKDIINNHHPAVMNWRDYFIESPGAWEYMADDKFVRWDNENEIYLMRTTRMSGTHAELRTYYLYSKIKSTNSWQKEYYDVSGRDEQPCLYFEKKRGSETFVIDIIWDIQNGGGYYLNLFTREKNNANLTPIVSANKWGLGLSDPADPNSRYKSGLMSESDIISLAVVIMTNI